MAAVLKNRDFGLKVSLIIAIFAVTYVVNVHFALNEQPLVRILRQSVCTDTADLHRNKKDNRYECART